MNENYFRFSLQPANNRLFNKDSCNQPIKEYSIKGIVTSRRWKVRWCLRRQKQKMLGREIFFILLFILLLYLFHFFRREFFIRRRSKEKGVIYKYSVSELEGQYGDYKQQVFIRKQNNLTSSVAPPPSSTSNESHDLQNQQCSVNGLSVT